MKIGTCITIKNIRLAKEFGYDFVELPGVEIASFNEKEWLINLKNINTSGINVLGINSYCDENFPLVGPSVDTYRNSQYLKLILKRANELGCRYIGIGAPSARIIPDEFPYHCAIQQMNAFLTEASLHAKKYGITILYEAINRDQCNFGNTINEIYSTVTSQKLENLKIVWDIYHTKRSKDINPTYHFNQIKHIHLCSWDNDFRRLYLNEKDKPLLKEIARLILVNEYTGSLSIEADDINFSKDGKKTLDLMNSYFNSTE